MSRMGLTAISNMNALLYQSIASISVAEEKDSVQTCTDTTSGGIACLVA